MSSPTVNDILDELFDENRRILNELMFANKVVIKSLEFKDFIDSIAKEFVDHLKPDVKMKYEKLSLGLNRLIDQKRTNVSDESPNEWKTSDQPIKPDGDYHTTNEDNVTDEEVDEEQMISGDSLLENTVHLNPNNYEGSNDEEAIAEKAVIEKLSVRTENISLKPMTTSSAKAVTGQQLSHTSDGSKLSSKPSARKKIKTTSRVNKKLFPFKCGFNGCNAVFCKRKTMFTHRKLHQWNCEFPGCNFQTQYQYKMNYHLNSHSKCRPFQCDYCDKNYKYRRDLTEHMKRQHLDQCPNDPILVCDWNECHFRTKSMKALNAHKCSHTLPFECQICKHRFSTKNNMKKHLISKHKNNQ